MCVSCYCCYFAGRVSCKICFYSKFANGVLESIKIVFCFLISLYCLHFIHRISIALCSLQSVGIVAERFYDSRNYDRDVSDSQSHPRDIVSFLDKTLYDTHVCVLDSGKQQ